MKTVALTDGGQWPNMGLGTWRLGESAGRKKHEVAALRRAFEIGFRLVDTAEMYGEGCAEEVVGQAMHEAVAAGVAERGDFIVVSKFYPHHADRRAVQTACERSLRRLRLDRLDLYLLHWRGSVPLVETIAGLQALQQRGLIARWGVSNFDLDDMRELVALRGGGSCSANQVCYSLGERGIEFELLPWQQRRRMPVMAYCPIDQGRLGNAAPLQALAAGAGLRAAEVALAWVVSKPGVIAIPKAVQEAHLLQNWRAATVELDAEMLRALDGLYPPPDAPQPLAMT